MSDIKATRYFEVKDWEADGKEPVTFKLAVSDIEVPEGVTDYDIGVILEDLITGSGFNFDFTEVQASQVKAAEPQVIQAMHSYEDPAVRRAIRDNPQA